MPGPVPPAIATGCQVVHLLRRGRIQPYLVEERHEKDNAEDSDRPRPQVSLRDQVDRPEIEHGAQKFDIAEGVIKDRDECGIYAQQLGHAARISFKASGFIYL